MGIKVVFLSEMLLEGLLKLRVIVASPAHFGNELGGRRIGLCLLLASLKHIDFGVFLGN